MEYAISYEARQFGMVELGPLLGTVLDDERVEIIDAETRDEAIAWAIQRKNEYLPNGRVEVWSRQYVVSPGRRKGAFRELKVAEV